MTEPPPARSPVCLPLVLAAVLGLGVAGAGVWFAGQPPKQAVAPECQAAEAVAKRIAPLARGEVAAVAVARTPKPSLAATFQNAAGAPMTLGDLKGYPRQANLGDRAGALALYEKAQSILLSLDASSDVREVLERVNDHAAATRAAGQSEEGR